MQTYVDRSMMTEAAVEQVASIAEKFTAGNLAEQEIVAWSG